MAHQLLGGGVGKLMGGFFERFAPPDSTPLADSLAQIDLAITAQVRQRLPLQYHEGEFDPALVQARLRAEALSEFSAFVTACAVQQQMEAGLND